MDYLVPEGAGIYFLDDGGGVGIDGELLCVRPAVHGRLHEFVIDAYRHVCACDFACLHLCVDEVLAFRVFYGYGKHQRTATSVLSHFARGVAVTFHKRHDAGGCEC